MGCFLSKYEFWWRFRQDLYVFCAKNCFRNAKFSEFGGLVWVGVFALGVCTKKGTLQEVTERCGEFPNQPNSTKIGM